MGREKACLINIQPSCEVAGGTVGEKVGLERSSLAPHIGLVDDRLEYLKCWDYHETAQSTSSLRHPRGNHRMSFTHGHDALHIMQGATPLHLRAPARPHTTVELVECQPSLGSGFYGRPQRQGK